MSILSSTKTLNHNSIDVKDDEPAIGRKPHSIGSKELILELNPVKTEGVEEALEHVHHEQDTGSDTGKNGEAYVRSEPINVQSRKHGFLPKDSGELGVSKRQGPKTEVGGGVGNHTKDKLNGLYSLMNEDLSKTVLFVVVLTTMMLFVFVVVFDGLVGLPRQEKGLGKEQNGNRNEGDDKEDVLDNRLSGVQRLVDITRLESNINESSDEIGRLATVARSTVVKRALRSSVIVASARVSPRSTGTISGLIANNPLAVIGRATPSAAGGIKTGSGKHAGVPIDNPLHEDEHNHVDEERTGEGNHGKDLEKEVKLISEVNRVAPLEASSRKHLDDTKNNTDLHLEGVEEEKLVCGHMPDGVEAERVDRSISSVAIRLVSYSSFLNFAGILAFERPAGSEQVQTKRKAIVVHKSRVDGEESHHEL